MKTKLVQSIDDKETTRLLQSIVQIPSVTGNEIECATYLQDYLKSHGFQTTFDQVDKQRANVLATIKGEDPKQSLIFNGHIDVVPPGNLENWKYPPFDGIIKENRLHGRGTADMKGGVAAMITAAICILKADLPLKGDLRIQCVIDEERGSKYGTKRLIELGHAEGCAAIIPEPTNLEATIASKGDIGLKITAHGKTAHASQPWKGLNAINKMIELIQMFYELPKSQKWDTLRNHPIVGPPTINVSVIDGGRQRNMVPDLCSIVLDRRSVPRYESSTQVFNELKTVIERFQKSNPNIPLDIETMLIEDPMEVQPDIPLVKSLFKAHQEIISEPPKIGGLHGFADGRLFVNDANIPAVIYGPGGLGLAHADNEYIDLPQVHKCSRVLAGLAYDLLVSNHTP